MRANKAIAILTALLLASCASSVQVDTVRQRLLAVEVEVTANEVKPLDARILFAPPPTNSAVPALRVKANGVEGWEYTIANPLIAQVEGQQTVVLESARIPVFAPLSPALTSITIEPIAESGTAIRGGTFDVRQLAAQACARMRSSIAGCREIESRFE